MKFLASILFVLFISFLTTPTLVMLIEKSADMSLVFDYSEEENQKENKEVKDLKSDCTLKNQMDFITLKFNTSKKIISENGRNNWKSDR